MFSHKCAGKNATMCYLISVLLCFQRGVIRDDRRALTPLRPRFAEVISKQYENSTVITCRVISDTKADIKWYREDQRLYSSEKYHMETLSENVHTLTIRNLREEDEGQSK